MTTPPLHEIDAFHAHITAKVQGWATHVYPLVTTVDPDPARCWWNVAANLLNVGRSTEDPEKGLALLAEIAAAALLAYAPHHQPRNETPS